MQDNENIFCLWYFWDFDMHSLWKKAVNFMVLQARAALVDLFTYWLKLAVQFYLVVRLKTSSYNSIYRKLN